MPKKWYLCVEMAGKGLISRMSDECLMKGKPGISYFGEYQAGMRKFTLALKRNVLKVLSEGQITPCIQELWQLHYSAIVYSHYLYFL